MSMTKAAQERLRKEKAERDAKMAKQKADREKAAGRLKDIGREIKARVGKLDQLGGKAVDMLDSIDHLLTDAEKLCDPAGFTFAAFKKTYCPELGQSRTYELLAIEGGRKTLEDIRADTRKRVAKHRAAKQDVTEKDSVTSPEGTKETPAAVPARAAGSAQGELDIDTAKARYEAPAGEPELIDEARKDYIKARVNEATKAADAASAAIRGEPLPEPAEPEAKPVDPMEAAWRAAAKIADYGDDPLADMKAQRERLTALFKQHCRWAWAAGLGAVSATQALIEAFHIDKKNLIVSLQDEVDEAEEKQRKQERKAKRKANKEKREMLKTSEEAAAKEDAERAEAPPGKWHWRNAAKEVA